MNPEDYYPFIYKTVRAYKEFVDDLQEQLGIKKTDDENEKFNGYLIDKGYFNYWKKFTDYEIIKNRISKKNFQESKLIISNQRRNNPLKDYQPDANQCIFYNPFELYKSIKMKGKQYALVDKNFWNLICTDEGIDEPGIDYYVDENKIIFSFASRGKLEIETDDNILRDNKEMLLKEINNFEKEEFDDEDEDLYMKELKKLLLLYAYEQDLKNKINNLRFQDNNFQDYYLISKEWIEEYKRYYHYDELCNLINNQSKLRNLLNKGYNNAKKYIEYSSSKISITRKKQNQSFPENLKVENTFLSEGQRIRINNNEISYWKNFEPVNKELKDLFSNSQLHGYDIESVSSANGLINSGKLILDLSNAQNNEGNFAFEIGFIGNKDMIFIDEYIFQYNNEQDKNNHLNFFKDKFYLFQKDELNFNMNLQCELFNDEGNVYGTAFKIPPHE